TWAVSNRCTSREMASARQRDSSWSTASATAFTSDRPREARHPATQQRGHRHRPPGKLTGSPEGEVAMLVLQGARERVELLQFSPDGRTLVAPCRAGVQVWGGLAAGPPTARIALLGVWSARFTGDGRKLLLVGSPARVALLDVAGGHLDEVPLEWPGAGGH